MPRPRSKPQSSPLNPETVEADIKTQNFRFPRFPLFSLARE